MIDEIAYYVQMRRELNLVSTARHRRTAARATKAAINSPFLGRGCVSIMSYRILQ